MKATETNNKHLELALSSVLKLLLLKTYLLRGHPLNTYAKSPKNEHF